MKYQLFRFYIRVLYLWSYWISELESVSESNSELEKQSRLHFSFSLSIFSSHLFEALSVQNTCPECQRIFWLSFGWGCWNLCGCGWGWGCWNFCFSAWRVCGCGHWKFCICGFLWHVGSRFWGCILGWLCRLSSQSSSPCSSSLLQMGQFIPHVQFFAACLGVSIMLGIAAA